MTCILLLTEKIKYGSECTEWLLVNVPKSNHMNLRKTKIKGFQMQQQIIKQIFKIIVLLLIEVSLTTQLLKNKNIKRNE